MAIILLHQSNAIRRRRKRKTGNDDKMNMNLVVLAKKMMLTPSQAVALPAVVTSAARECKMSEHQIIFRCFDDGAVREYLASVCRKVTA